MTVGLEKLKIHEGTAMKFRILSICVLGLAAWTLALPSYARGIVVDETITCSSVVTPTGTPAIILKGTGAVGNSAHAGVNFQILTCADSLQGDTTITSLPYEPKHSNVYTWVDLSVAGITASSLTGPPGNPNTPPLSNFQNLNVAIIAQIEVLKLKGSYTGDYEIIFNYETFPEIACDNVFTPILPGLTWYKTRYAFTGAGVVGGPCESSGTSSTTNDFLFGPDGVLLGYNSAPDGSGFVLTPGLPPGWTTE